MKRKIYFLTDYWLPKLGGMERSIQYLSAGLSKTNSVYLITGAAQDSRESYAGMTVIRFAANQHTSYYPSALSFIAQQGGEQIAHVFGFSFQWPEQQAQLLVELKESCHLPILFKIPTSGDVTKYLNHEFRAAKHHIDQFITLNARIKQELLQAGIEEERILSITNSVPCDFYKPPSLKEKLEARKTLGLPQEGVIFCFCGRFIARKRIDILIDAMRAVPKAKRPYLVLVGYADHTFGDGFPVEQYLDGYIQLIPTQLDMRPVYHAADIYFTASEAEGMSNAVLEALASGLPVLAHNIAGHAEMVIHGENGFLFEQNIPEIASYILALQEKVLENRIQDFAACSRQLALARFDSRLLVEQYNTIYSRLLT